MDISNIKPVERVIEILHPSSEKKLNIQVTIISLNDVKMSSIRRKIQNQRIELEKKGKAFKADDIENNEQELLLNAITGWVWGGDAKFNGEKPAFNEKNVKTILKELPWFKNQIMEAIGDEKGFFID